jgi:serine/threonine protein kinase/formylglycine-generating enzyme required for sulfatase activity/predicted esterase
MTVNKPERLEQVKQIYHDALALDATGRADFLAEVCADDEELRREVESLLAYQSQAERFCETPAFNLATEILAAEELERVVGRRIGAYKIIEPLGAGGMGEVYLARDSRLGRKVALKLLPARFVLDAERVQRFAREARAASALNHPNIVTIYEIGESENTHFIAAEFIDGETLRQNLAGGRMKPEIALEIAAQVAEAMMAAHEAGIAHRDIKPENIMLRRDGYVKVLDFGLAKLTEPRPQIAESQDPAIAEVETSPGMVIGTVRYMSPEQARGMEVDARTDIFSLGIALYEMLSGCAPFIGPTTSDVIAMILTASPQPLRMHVPETPAELEAIVNRALTKDRDARYQTARELLTDLTRLRERLEFEAKLKLRDSGQSAQNFSTMIAPGLRAASSLSRLRPGSLRRAWPVIIVLIVALAGIWFYRRSVRLKWAKDAVARVERLAQAQQHFAAYDLALEAQRSLPHDETIARLMPVISDRITVVSQPPGAKVFLRRFLPDGSGESSPRQLVGVTPLNDLRVARGEYILYLEKDGHAHFKRTISSKLSPWGTAMLPPDEPTKIDQRLVEAEKLPDRMAFVPGGTYKLAGWDKPIMKSVRLDDYLIDKYEVTNREYKEFIDAGGYFKRQYWKFPFSKDGKILSWEEAMAYFKDRSGLPGPRSWRGQSFPADKAEHPVTEITWYEAAAYAGFRNKQLPTIFQWEKAARNGLFTYYSANILPWGPTDVWNRNDNRANFQSDGTKPVGVFEFGMSPFGCYDMAGNVAEWCLNETSGEFYTAGGSWDDLSYLFGYFGELPGLYSSGKLGFRCVVNDAAAQGDQGGMRIDDDHQVPLYTAPSDAAFRALLSHYRYDRTPLDATVVEVKETQEWRREKINYLGARDERVIAYLYLPKNYQKPFHVIQFVPAGDVYGGYLTMTNSLEIVLAPHIKAGRAVFAVVFKGFKERERPPGYVSPKPSSIKRREEMVDNATDLRRGLDYLATRNDVDATRIAYFGYSQGATEGLIYTAVDPRYRSVVMVGGGMWPPGKESLAEISLPNFAPHIRAPKLMLNGRYDEVHPFKTMIDPLYKLLRDPKKLVLFDGSHSPPIEIAVPLINDWLDETLGQVKHH